MGSATGAGTTFGGGVGTTLGGATGWLVLVREHVRWAIGSSRSRALGRRNTLGDAATGTVSGTRTLVGLAGFTLGWVKVVFGRRGDGRDSCLLGIGSFAILGSRGWIHRQMACLRASTMTCLLTQTMTGASLMAHVSRSIPWAIQSHGVRAGTVI